MMLSRLYIKYKSFGYYSSFQNWSYFKIWTNIKLTRLKKLGTDRNRDPVSTVYDCDVPTLCR